MCGIAGWIDYSANLKNQSGIAKNMNGAIAKRGPDAQGFYFHQSAILTHRRLIVVDPENGGQPMKLDHGGDTLTMVYNGELYNTEELRRELLSLGWQFKGHSDTEVLLKSYAEWGGDCLNKLNGIYAFAVWQEKSKTLFAARDKIGVKPFFFYRYNGGLVFASEIKALLQNPKVPKRLGDYGLKQLLFMSPGRAGGFGVIKDVKELKPGECLKFDKDKLEIRRYWRLKAEPHTLNQAQTVDKTRELITSAVERQLVSDVPLACFLSGGLDSSIISMIAAKKYALEGKTLTTYSVDYEDNDKYFVSNAFQPTADGYYIDLMSRFIKSRHKNIVLDNLDVARALEEAVLARDLPGMADIDSSLLLFCREIKKEHTVCLSGECADEIFGGYPWYHNKDILFNEAFPWSNSTDMRKQLFVGDVYEGNAEEFVKSEYDKIVSDTDFLDSDSPLEKRMREMFMLNFYSFMQTLLDRKDRMSMYNSLEVRVPFCDHRLVEFAFNMPWELKSLKGREKGIVREAFKDLLPIEITQRKKSPYPKTFNPVFLEYVKNRAADCVKNGKVSRLINKEYFKKLLSGEIAMDTPWYGQLMRIPQIFAYIIQTEKFLTSYNIEI